MDEHDRREVRTLVKYCHRNTRLIVDQAMERGRVNRRALSRAGMTQKQIKTAIERLRSKLRDYDHGEN